MESLGRWCDKPCTISLHFWRSCAITWDLAKVSPVHSWMLSVQSFLCLPLLRLPSTVPWRMTFARPVERVTCPYHFNFLFFTMVSRSSYGPNCSSTVWRIVSLVIWSLYEMPSMIRRLLISTARIFFCNSALRVQVSQAYRKMESISARCNLILCISVMFLSFHMIFNLASAVIVWAVLAAISGFDPLSLMIAPRYLNCFTVSNFAPFTVMSLEIQLLLFTISFVFSALISIPNFVDVLSSWVTRSESSFSFPAMPSMSSANLRFVMFLPPILIVPSCSSKASFIILSRKMLKSIGEMRHPWRTPTEVWNHSPMAPCTITALVALAYNCCMVNMSFWPMLYFFIVAHSASCQTLSNAFLKSIKTW